MAQKLILCKGTVGSDLLASQPLAGYIAEGYEVTSIDGFSSVDNCPMCWVLLAEPAQEATTDDTTEGDNTGGGSSDGENTGGGSSDGENTSDDTTEGENTGGEG